MLQGPTLIPIEVTQSYQSTADCVLSMRHLQDRPRPELGVKSTGGFRTDAVIVELQVMHAIPEARNRRQSLPQPQ